MRCIIVVLNWPLFFADAVYTERYMGNPKENSDFYKVNFTQITILFSKVVVLLGHTEPS